jgi:shikimate kinase
MGSGKTHWGRLLSQKLSFPFFDLDEQIESHEGRSIPEIFSQSGEEHFRLTEKDALHIITESHDSFVMASGGGSPCYFNNIEYMNRSGITVWLNTPIDILYQRIVERKRCPPTIERLNGKPDKRVHCQKICRQKDLL